MRKAILEFLQYADANGIKRLYEIFPQWLARYPKVYAASAGIQMLDTCLGKNDHEYRCLNSRAKTRMREKRLAAYRLIFKEALGGTRCQGCGRELTRLTERGTVPPSMRLLQHTHLWCSVKCVAISEERTETRKRTCLERYGVEHTSMTEEWKETVKASFTRRYGEGITNPSHVPQVVEKILSSRYGRKEIQLRGKTFGYQGYEGALLTYLVEVLNVEPRDITTHLDKVNSFEYTHLGRTHKYFPDVKFRRRGKVWYAEVKSMSTLGSTRAIASRVLAKARAMWDCGKNYRVVLAKTDKQILAVAATEKELIALINQTRRSW